MQAYRFFRDGSRPQRIEEPIALPEEDGFIWLDFTRSSARSWPEWAERLAGVIINEDHLSDSFNGDHPSYYEGTADYDMLIFQALTPEDCENSEELIVTKSAAFFFFDRLLITVRAAENHSFEVVKRKFLESRLRFPSTTFGIVHVVLDTMVERYFTITDELETRLDRMGDSLMDPKSPFNDWQALLRYRKQAHALEMLCEKNTEVLDAWRRTMRQELSEGQRIRFNDLREHIGRVERHADALQRDIEVAVQLHFSSVAHRTNKIVQALTVLSAVFFPLTLLTGIWGMNFEHMPGLKWRYGYLLAIFVIVGLGAGLLIYFKKRRFF